MQLPITKTPWFARRSGGLNWVPCRWQGWAVIGAAAAAIAIIAAVLHAQALIPVLAVVACLVVIALLTGASPSNGRSN